MLNQDEKMALESMMKHPGFAVLKKIENEESVRLGKILQAVDLDDPKQLELLKRNQIYAKAREDFLLNAESHVSSVIEPEI